MGVTTTGSAAALPPGAETTAQYGKVEMMDGVEAGVLPQDLRADGMWHPIAELTGEPTGDVPVAPLGPTIDSGVGGAKLGAAIGAAVGAIGGALAWKLGGAKALLAIPGALVGMGALGAVIGWATDYEGGKQLPHPARYLVSPHQTDVSPHGAEYGEVPRTTYTISTEHSTLPGDAARLGELEAAAVKDSTAKATAAAAARKDAAASTPAAPVTAPPETTKPTRNPDGSMDASAAASALGHVGVWGEDHDGIRWKADQNSRGTYDVYSRMGSVGRGFTEVFSLGAANGYRYRGSSDTAEGAIGKLRGAGVTSFREW